METHDQYLIDMTKKMEEYNFYLKSKIRESIIDNILLDIKNPSLKKS